MSVYEFLEGFGAVSVAELLGLARVCAPAAFSPLHLIGDAPLFVGRSTMLAMP
ncbi:hypothetical protein [Streptomyces sp. NA04227]|uniref:hypothetical protein n=1 Tax=Streptomyces sp. NA04227 TaxID=2742136 RepID=UPI0020CA4C1E|nr:hypothetical protein [Streptomyces sp. NA04227]